MVKELTLNKAVAAFIGVAMVVGLASALAVSRAHAVTLAELVELFIALEVIPADKADEARTVLSSQDAEAPSSLVTTMSCNFTRNLAVGDTGTDVMDLQKLLNAKGFTIAVTGAGSNGQESSYYGQLTAAAVSKMQEAFASEILSPLGLTMGTGYFGASTRAKANALCAAAPTTPTTPDDEDEDMDEDTDNGDLGNGEGSIDAITSASADESSLEEGTEGGVLAFEVEIEGDVMINRVDVYLADPVGVGASNNADDYFVGAYLEVGGEKVAELDADDFSEDDYDVVSNDAVDEYRLRFSGLDLVYADGDEPEFQVGFEVLGNLDSDDAGASWTVELDSVRYEDGEGFMDTEAPGTAISESFNFQEEDVAELKVTEATSNPDASTIEVDQDDVTEDVAVFVFDIEERNGVDTTVNDISMTVSARDASAVDLNEDDVVARATLYDGSTELDSVTVADLGAVVFEDLDLEIDADDEVTLTVKLDLEDTNSDAVAAYEPGSQVMVAFVDVTSLDDANGNDEGEVDVTGTPSSEWHTLYEAGLIVEVVEAETDVTTVGDAISGGASNADNVTFTWKLDVTAFGDEDVYVTSENSQILATANADVDVDFLVEVSSGAAIASLSGTISSTADEVTGADLVYGDVYDGDTFFVVESGTTETLTIVVTGTNATDAKQVQAYI